MIPAPKKDHEHKSALVRAIEARPRAVRIMDVNFAVGVLDKPIHKIAFRVNVKAEENDAIDRAHKHLQAKLGTEEARKDAEVLTDAKLIAALYHACREVKVTYDERGAVVNCEVTNYPAFPAPEWMHDHLTTDQIAVLINMYNAVKTEMSPLRPFDSEITDEILSTAGHLADDAAPGLLFAAFTRDAMADMLVHASRRLVAARGALAEAEQQPEGFRLLDVEMAALTLEERAFARDDAAAKAYAQGLRDALAVLRGQRSAESLVPEEQSG